MKEIRLFVCAVCVVGVVVSLGALVTREHTTLRVSVLDVGQGDSVLIESPTGCDIVVDTGPQTGVVVSRLGHALAWFDRSIDVEVLTHSHVDHTGGEGDIENRFSVASVIGATGTTREENIREGDRISCGDGVYLEVLRFNEARANDAKSPHGGALVSRIVYGATSMLLASDIDSTVESELVARYGSALQSDVLKVAHHGSRTATSELFLKTAKPRLAVISVGAGNTFGHPHKETLDRLERSKIEIVRTDEVGTVMLESDGTEFTLSSR